MRILILLLCTVPAFLSLPPQILPVLLLHPASAAPQNSFSPFSILGSLFSSNPPWSRPPPTSRQRKPQPQPQKIFFRPHLSSHQAGPTFSASQQVPQIVPFKSVRAPSPVVRPSRGNLSPVNPTKIIRITSPSNFSSSSSYPVVPVTPPASPTTPSPRPSLSSIVSNTVDTSLPAQHEQVEVVYPSNSVVPSEDVVTEQSIFSSFPSKDSHLSGPNHEEFPIVSLIDLPSGHNYYDEVFHNTVSSQSAARQVPSRNVQPFYAAEEFNYNQDPIDLGLVHGTGSTLEDSINSVSGSGPQWETEGTPDTHTDTQHKEESSLITTLDSVSSVPAFSSLDNSFTLSPSTSSSQSSSSSLHSTSSLPFSSSQPSSSPLPSALPLVSVPTSISSSSPTFSTFLVSSTPSAPFITHSSSNSPASHISSPSFSSSTTFSSSSSTSQSSSSSSAFINFTLPQSSSSSSPSLPITTTFNDIPSTPSSSLFTSPSNSSTSSFSSSSSTSSHTYPSSSSVISSSSSPSVLPIKTEKPVPRGKSSKSSTFSSQNSPFSSKNPTLSSQNPTFTTKNSTLSSQTPTFSPPQTPTFSPPEVPTFSPPENSPTFFSQPPTFSPDFDEEVLTTDPRHERLVNTISYRATDYSLEERDNSANSFNSSLTDLGSLVDCGSGREVGWCSVSPSYPTHLVEEMVTGCEQVLEAYKAVISQDLDLLGDNSPSIISSEKDHSRPWSWKVYAYKKKQVCASELYFMKPALARDSQGVWRVILQTPSQSQTIAVDMCHSPDSVCPGLQDCGKKSRCVQRYNYQLLLSLPASSSTTGSCPSLHAFRFPSGCVCHAETTGE